MNKFFLKILSLVMIIIAAGASNASAADYTIIVTDSALSKNQELVFAENNIGPGFASHQYPIVVHNQTAEAIAVKLVSIEPDANDQNDLLPGIRIGFWDLGGRMVFNDTVRDLNSLEVTSSCVPPGGEEVVFNTNFWFDSVHGNEFQDTSFRIIYTFEVAVDTECDVVPPDTGKLPPTGEVLAVFGFLTVTFVAGLILGAFFIILILKKRSRGAEKKGEHGR